MYYTYSYSFFLFPWQDGTKKERKERKSRSATQTLFKSSKALLYFGERISLLGIPFSSSYYPGSAAGRFEEPIMSFKE